MAALSWHVKRSWLVVQRGLLSKLPLRMIVRSLWITSCGYGGQGAHWRPQVQTLHGKIHVLQGSTRGSGMSSAREMCVSRAAAV